MTLVRLSAVIALTAVGVSLGNRATAASVYYVPQTGASPYDWSVLGNWFKDSAGTTALGALPGLNDEFFLSNSVLNGQEIEIPNGTTANIYGLSLGTESVRGKLTIGNGASLKYGHSSYIGKKGSSNELHVASGGTLTTASYSILGYMGSSNGTAYYGSHILVDEGGTYNQKGTALFIGDGYRGDAFVENHGTMNLDSWLLAGTFGDTGQYCTNKAAHASTYIKGYLHNYGTFSTSDHSSKQIVLGACRYGRGYIYNYAGATSTIKLPMYVGSCTNANGYVYNSGEMTSSRLVYLGGRGPSDNTKLTSSNNYPCGYLYNQAGGELTLDSDFRIGTVRYGRGFLDIAKDSEATLNGAVKIGYAKYSQGTIDIHGGGTLTASGDFVLGNLGYGKMLVHGQFYPTATTPFKIGANSHDWASNKGELEVSAGGRYYGSRKGIEIATAMNGTEGHVLLAGTGKIEKPGAINMATGTTSVATFTIAGSGILQNPAQIRVGLGSETAAVTTQSAKLVMSNNAAITGMTASLYIAAGVYSRGEVVVADNAKIEFSAPVHVNVASGSPTAEGLLRLRGGTIVLETNSVVRVGRDSSTVSACNGVLSGWGRIDRLKPDLDSGKGDVSIAMHCGAITADGEGEDRDLDLSVIRRVNTSDALGANNSGTNGWYAVNGGRLTYPCRNSTCVNLGEYYGRDVPVFVNAVHFDFVGKSGYLIGQLYATDRTDIPAGLPADDPAQKTLRLGVWRATVNNSYKNATNVTAQTCGSVSSAEITVRYDNFRLAALKNENGVFSSEQRVALYRHDGTASGRWIKVASLDATEAEANGHLIGGALPKVGADWNLGFFAVVAEPKKGTSIIIR